MTVARSLILLPALVNAFALAAENPKVNILQNPSIQWSQWRGPLGNGYAPHANPPVEWSETKNIRWKTALPGLGHSSPIVWSDHVYLTTGVPQGEKLPVPEQPTGAHNNLDPFHKLNFTVLAINRRNGKIVWQKIMHTAQPHQSTHESATLSLIHI